MQTILELSAEDARRYFMKAECYCNIDLPEYFDFQPLLNELKKKGTEVDEIKVSVAKDHDKVNYKFFNSKDGMYTWRPLQLIHPVIYANLVNIITREENWQLIVNRFKKFGKNDKIKCCSIPMANVSGKSVKESTIFNWWTEIEQRSVELAIDYYCFLSTDITDCYGSIYTHAIPWALHNKNVSKENRDNTLLGNIIDERLRSMSYGQTNGIPQGSVLMDFIAEMVLGYADMKLSEKISEYNKQNHNSKIEKYQILRYRDDYRIFGTTQGTVTKIAYLLTGVLQDLNFNINAKKTFLSTNIVRDTIKPDKYWWNTMKQYENNLQKQLLIIHSLSLQQPNSGSLEKALHKFHNAINPEKVFKEHTYKVLVSILIDIAYNNPRSYRSVCYCIGKIMLNVPDKREKLKIYESIENKFKRIPNAGYMQVWIQRMTLKLDDSAEYDEKLCKLVTGEDNASIWNSKWVKNKKISKMLENNNVINKEIIANMPEVPLRYKLSNRYNG